MQGVIIKSLGRRANYYFKSWQWKGQPPIALHGKNFEKAMEWEDGRGTGVALTTCSQPMMENWSF